MCLLADNLQNLLTSWYVMEVAKEKNGREGKNLTSDILQTYVWPIFLSFLFPAANSTQIKGQSSIFLMFCKAHILPLTGNLDT